MTPTGKMMLCCAVIGFAAIVAVATKPPPVVHAPALTPAQVAEMAPPPPAPIAERVMTVDEELDAGQPDPGIFAEDGSGS